MLVGEYIKNKRLKNKESQIDVANKLGVTSTVIWSVENSIRPLGKRIPASKWAEALSLDACEKKEFYNLVGVEENSLAPDLKEYIATHPEVNNIIRAMMIAEKSLTD